MIIGSLSSGTLPIEQAGPQRRSCGPNFTAVRFGVVCCLCAYEGAASYEAAWRRCAEAYKGRLITRSMLWIFVAVTFGAFNSASQPTVPSIFKANV